ncbi:alkaline ceramidase-like [Primulina eburnea]|uniref:alkaline ceramidase-like n=1 Tax=Primulina eburnea TaxID=1245227 RepID=UPI003C6C4580
MTVGVSIFVGRVTSTHEWCEPNYAYSSYVAEYFNTISNVPCIILALIGLVNALRQRFEKRFSVLHDTPGMGPLPLSHPLAHPKPKRKTGPSRAQLISYKYQAQGNFRTCV